MQRLRNYENHSMLRNALKEPIIEVLVFMQVRISVATCLAACLSCYVPACLPASAHPFPNHPLPSTPTHLHTQVKNLEVPFIWTYRRDYLHAQMTRKHLWLIAAWDEKWEKLYVMKKRYTHTHTFRHTDIHKDRWTDKLVDGQTDT